MYTPYHLLDLPSELFEELKREDKNELFDYMQFELPNVSYGHWDRNLFVGDTLETVRTLLNPSNPIDKGVRGKLESLTTVNTSYSNYLMLRLKCNCEEIKYTTHFEFIWNKLISYQMESVYPVGLLTPPKRNFEWEKKAAYEGYEMRGENCKKSIFPGNPDQIVYTLDGTYLYQDCWDYTPTTFGIGKKGRRTERKVIQRSFLQNPR